MNHARDSESESQSEFKKHGILSKVKSKSKSSHHKQTEKEREKEQDRELKKLNVIHVLCVILHLLFVLLLIFGWNCLGNAQTSEEEKQVESLRIRGLQRLSL